MTEPKNPHTPKTWDDIIERACRRSTDPWELDTVGPLFHMMVSLVERGDVTREQAVIALALGLGEIVDRQKRYILDLLNTRPWPSSSILFEKPL